MTDFVCYCGLESPLIVVKALLCSINGQTQPGLGLKPPVIWDEIMNHLIFSRSIQSPDSQIDIPLYHHICLSIIYF